MTLKRKKYSLYKDYLSFAAIIVVSFIALSIVISYAIYNSHKKHNEIITITEGNRISEILAETFDYTNKISVYMGKQIAEHNPSDLNFILNIFQKTSGEQYKATNLFSWSLFDWVDKNNKQLINSKNGISKDPTDMSFRDYSWKCPKNPWTLQLSKPGIGTPSGRWVIPAGTGIIDQSGNYLGAIVVGFNVEMLEEKITQATSSRHISYVIIDENFGIIMQSVDNSTDPESSIFSNILNKDNYFSSEQSGNLNKPIEIDNIIYTRYNKMDNYPYIILTGFNKSFINRDFSSLLLPRIIELAGLSIFFLVLLFLFRQHIILPIVKLSDAADNIMRGETIKKVPRTPTYETTNLARQLIYMQGYIKRMERIDRKLFLAKKESEYANKIKSDFLANMSHELRTPLNAIIGYSEIMKSQIFGPMNNEKYLEYAKDIHSSGKHLLSVISDLLDLSKSEAGNLSLNKQETDFANIVKESIKMFSETINYKNIKIKTDIAPDVTRIFADETRIKQIIINLLSNAIKFSYPNSEIRIKGALTETNFCLTIEDDGIGITKKDIPKILEKFGYVKNAMSRNSDGTGLGLWITKMLVESHGGTLAIDSNLGSGTKVIINLPKDIIVS